MVDRKSADCKIMFFNKDPALNGDHVDGKGSRRTPHDHSVEQVVNALQGCRPGIDFQFADGFPAQVGGNQPANSQNMVQVAVGNQQAVQFLETQTGL